MPHNMTFARRHGMFCLAALASAACLCSCGENDKNAPAPAAPAATSAESSPDVISWLKGLVSSEATESDSAVDEARKTIYHQLLEEIGPLVTEHAQVPEFNEPAKVYLESLQEFYALLAAQPVTVERADIAYRIAKLTLNLGAYAKAHEAFDRALEDFDALPEAARDAVSGKRLLSALLNGKGACLLRINKAADAIPYYEKALEADIAVLRDLGIADDAALPEGEPNANLSRAAADVLGSYRCLGEAHAVAGDLEEARDFYKKGLTRMEQLKRLDTNSGMGIAYVKLRSALGDLESRCGNEREALLNWARAAQDCKSIFMVTRRADVKVQTKRYAEALLPLIKEKSSKLQAEAEARKSEEAAREAAEAAEVEKAVQEATAAQAAAEARAAEEEARAQEAEKAAAAKVAEEAAAQEAEKQHSAEEPRERRSHRSRNHD